LVERPCGATARSHQRQIALRHHKRIDRERVRGILAAFDDALDDGRPRVELWRDIERSAFRGD